MKKLVITAAIAVATLSTVLTARATLVNLDYVGTGIGKSINVTASGPGIYRALNNVFIGVYKIKVGTVPYDTFCIDFADNAGDDPKAELVSLASAPDSWAGPMGSTAAATISMLWAKYYSGAVSSADEAAALQVAIWRTIDLAKTEYSLTFSGNDAAVNRAVQMLGDLGTMSAPLMAVTTTAAQDFIVPVPEPTTILAGALLLLPFAASTIRRFRKTS